VTGALDQADAHNPAPVGGPWRLRADVGGTFTDCVAIAPDGAVTEAKVLSSGAVRVEATPAGARRWRPQRPEDLAPLAAAVGGRVRFLGGESAGDARLSSVDRERGEFELSGPMDLHADPPAALEVLATEPAPIVAARLLTGAPVGRPLPRCEFRLATTRATNALLERTFAPVALIVSAGGDDPSARLEPLPASTGL